MIRPISYLKCVELTPMPGDTGGTERAAEAARTIMGILSEGNYDFGPREEIVLEYAAAALLRQAFQLDPAYMDEALDAREVAAQAELSGT